MSEVSRILSAVEQGDLHAAEQLLPLVCNELRMLAARKLAKERPGQTLAATALVHEAYIRLVPSPQKAHGTPSQHWNSRGHFFAAAAEAMRRILVESARRKRRVKHAGDHQRVDLDSCCVVSAVPSLDLVALDEALSRLGESEPAKAELVKLRFGQQLGNPARRVRDRAIGHVAQIGKRRHLQPVATLHDAQEDRRSPAAPVTSQVQRVLPVMLSAQHNRKN